MNIKVKPFDDIRVRKAMQMALNLEEINQGFYKGFADTIPQGQISRFNAAVAVQFDEWPADVRKVFEYDPAGAEALLDEAGYPRGDDGVRFKTEILHLKRYDLNHTELLISYWDAIGVKVEANVQPLAEFVARRQDRAFQMINAEAAFKGPPVNPVKRFIPSTSWNSANADDEWYNAKFAEALAASTLEVRDAALGELDMYGIEQFWQLFGPVGPQFSLTQPWVAGYNGESTLGLVYARLWFDSSLKP
jgi:peptide/nickel transport system substrate-binding protein